MFSVLLIFRIMNTKLTKKFIDTVNENKMLENGHKVLIAVSGGPDSVLLLNLFLKIQSTFSLNLNVFHLNHNLRGIESEKDLKFVKGLCEKFNLMFFPHSEDVLGYSKKHKISFEEAGHIIRYSLMKKCAEEIGANLIATGHNADDQAETLLMRILYGTSIDALAGITTVKENLIIRPLIKITKTEILDYLKEHDIKFRVDLTNNKAISLRNKIRNKLIPLIESDFQPKIKQNLIKLSEMASIDKRYFEEITSKLLKEITIEKDCVKIPLSLFAKTHPALLGRLLKKSIEIVKKDTKEINNYKICKIMELPLKQTSKKIVISSNIIALRGYNDIIITKAPTPKKKPNINEITIPSKKYYDEWNLTITAEVFNNPLPRQNNIIMIDADKLKGALILRSRKNGDRIFIDEINGSKKVKKFFIDKKIPLIERDLIPIIEDNSENTIICILGHYINNYYLASSSTKKFLLISFDGKGVNHEK